MFTVHHYNVIAKRFRERFPVDSPPMDQKERCQRAILATLALNFAERLKQDNDNFDPIKFLDACSPNPELYPLSELWEDE